MDVNVGDCACYALCPWLRTGPDLNPRSDPTGGQTKPGRTGELYGVESHDGQAEVISTVPQEQQDLMQDSGKGEGWRKIPVEAEGDPDRVQTYGKRWIMLGLFCVFSMSNAYMWIHLNIIANVVLRYYNDSLPADKLQQETAVDWLSMIYMLTYLAFIPLGMYILDSRGLRLNNLLGCSINALGAWLKCAALSPSRFPVIMAAQTLCGLAQVFIVSIPPRLAAVWFGPNEVSTATAFGVFGNQLGVAVGFLVPPLIVPNSDSLDDIGDNLSVMFYGGAGFNTLLMVLMMLVFQSRPPHPPSKAQLLMMRSRVHERYHSSILRLLKSRSFVLMMVSYGMITGCYYAISTLLNYVVLFHFPGEEVNVGNIGLTIILTGIAGSIVAGVWLDRTKYFKSTSVGIYLLCTIGMIVFTFTLDQGEIWVVFLTAGLLGFFMTGYLPVGYEFAAEITYPESEGTASGLLTASAMLFGIVMTLGMRAMMNQVSILAANLFVSTVLLIGTIMTGLIQSEYKRQEAERKILTRTIDVDIDDTVVTTLHDSKEQ